MWDHPIKSSHTSAERARHPLHNYRSVYMSCSSGVSSNAALQEQHQLSSPLGHYLKNHLSISGAGNASNVSGSPKGYRKVDSGSASSTMWSRNISNNEPDMLGYSISDMSQQSGRGSVYDLQVVKSLLVQNFKNSNNALCISRRDFPSKKSSVYFLEWNCRQHSISHPASHIQHQGSDLRECIDEGGRTSMPYHLCRQEKVDYLRSMKAFSKNLRDTNIIPKQGECNHQSDSTVLLSKKKLDMCSTSTKSLMPMSRKNDGSFLMLDNHRPAFGPLEEIHLSGTASHIQHQGSNLRECIDEGGRTSMPSHLCRQEKVDYLRSMKAFSKNLRDTNTIPKQGECNHQSDSTVLLSQKKLDMYSTSTKSLMPMSRKNDGSFLMLDNHRPAFGPLEEIHLSGEKSSLIDKDMISVKLLSTDAFASAGKGVRRKRVIPEIPDLNIALSDLPDAEGVMGNSDPSTNRTKCLGTTSLHAVQPSSTSRGIKRRKTSASGSISKSPSAQGMKKTEDASGSISFGTKSLNLGDSNPHEIVNRSFRKFGEGGLNMSELKFAGKEVIVLDSDDDADDGPASVTINGSSKDLMEVEKNIASDKSDKSPFAQGMEKTEEVARLWPQNWPLYPPTVRRTALENPEPTLVHIPQISCVALETIRGREVPSPVAMDVITSVSNKQIEIQEKVQNNKL